MWGSCLDDFWRCLEYVWQTCGSLGDSSNNLPNSSNKLSNIFPKAMNLQATMVRSVSLVPSLSAWRHFQDRGIIETHIYVDVFLRYLGLWEGLLKIQDVAAFPDIRRFFFLGGGSCYFCIVLISFWIVWDFVAVYFSLGFDVLFCF